MGLNAMEKNCHRCEKSSYFWKNFSCKCQAYIYMFSIYRGYDLWFSFFKTKFSGRSIHTKIISTGLRVRLKPKCVTNNVIFFYQFTTSKCCIPIFCERVLGNPFLCAQSPVNKTITLCYWPCADFIITHNSVPECSPDRLTFPVINNSVRKIVHQPRTACAM